MVSPKGSVVTIIPSIGSPKLADALASLSKQDYPDVDVYLVVDGKAKQQQVQDVINAFVKNSDSASKAFLPRIHVTTLSWNVGADGFFGHRIYAAFSHLVNHEFVTFLDEDNWYRPNHISSLVETLDTIPKRCLPILSGRYTGRTANSSAMTIVNHLAIGRLAGAQQARKSPRRASPMCRPISFAGNS